MKKYLLLVCVLGLTFHAFGQGKKSEQKNGAVISWEKQTHDFGSIVQGLLLPRHGKGAIPEGAGVSKGRVAGRNRQRPLPPILQYSWKPSHDPSFRQSSGDRQ